MLQKQPVKYFIAFKKDDLKIARNGSDASRRTCHEHVASSHGSAHE